MYFCLDDYDLADLTGDNFILYLDYPPNEVNDAASLNFN